MSANVLSDSQTRVVNRDGLITPARNLIEAIPFPELNSTLTRTEYSEASAMMTSIELPR